jgi:CRISPR/Cas system-associated exonuclease Cas4 (RecB family)
MKKTIRNIGSATLMGVMVITIHATSVAQTAVESTTTTKTITSAGTISEFSPATFVIKTATSPEPVRYTYTKTTTYVDETGKPVSMAIVKSGLPVTVFYIMDGDRMVASKVIVRKAVAVIPAAPVIEETRTTTTTTTEK